LTPFLFLKKNPKIPRKDRTPQPMEGRVLLENIVPEFQVFVEKTGELALSDAKANIKLKVTEFKKA
jgi:hypothetical protein